MTLQEGERLIRHGGTRLYYILSPDGSLQLIGDKNATSAYFEMGGAINFEEHLGTEVIWQSQGDLDLALASEDPYAVITGAPYEDPGGTGGGSGEVGSGTGTGDVTQSGGIPVGERTIPAGATVVKVKSEIPGGEPTFYITYSVFGVDLAYRVGTPEDFQAIFGDGAFHLFENITTVEKWQFDQMVEVRAGIDDIIGTTQSIASQIEAEMADMGIEGFPDWIMNSQEAMVIISQGIADGISNAAILSQLSGTTAFQNRFPSIDAVAAATGTTNLEINIQEYVTLENELRTLIRRYRGPDKEPSLEYLSQLIRTGWNPEDAETVLQGEVAIKNAPGALENLNAILEFQGKRPLDGRSFLKLMVGDAPVELIEDINDALRQAALSEQGVEITTAFAESLGPGGGLELLDAGQLQQSAEASARTILRYGLELDAEKFGINKEQIIQAAFGEGPSGQTQELLAKFARERARAAEGYGALTGFIDQDSNLRLQGVGNI